MSSVSYYNGKYLAVGSGNTVLTSTNGLNWSISTVGTNTWFITCGGGDGYYFVAGSELWVSSDGVLWQQRNIPASFSDIAFGNGLWVAATGGASVYISSNLVNWTEVAVGDPWMGPAMSRVCFTDSGFILGGAWRQDFGSLLSGTVLMSSPDGVTWTRTALNIPDLFGEVRDCVASEGGTLVALRDVFLYSPDNINWGIIVPAPYLSPSFNLKGPLRGVACSSSGTCVAVGDTGTVLISTNANQWEVISDEPREEIQSVAFGGNRFVAVGGSPSYIGGPWGSAAVFTSVDGVVWRSFLTNLTDQLSAVAYGNKVWVVCGDDGQIFVSPDASRWVNRSLPPTSHDLHTMTFGGGRFVAFADSRDLMYYSVSGTKWKSQIVAGASHVQKVKFVNNRFMAVCDNATMLVSKDGRKWHAVPTPASFNTIAFGKRQYVAASGFSVGCSSDGIKWSVQIVPISVDDIQFTNGKFVAVGSGGILTSNDGMHWTNAIGASPNWYLCSLATGNGVMVVGSGLNLYRGAFR